MSLRQGVKANFSYSRYYPVTICGQQEVLGFRQCNFTSFRNSGRQLCGSEVGLELTCGLGSLRMPRGFRSGQLESGLSPADSNL